MKRPPPPRIIAGTARGRRLQVPLAGVRPTKDRVKASVFSALDARGLLDGAVVLDLFAGCGALGLEALSRGAAQAVLVERDPAALHALRQNIAALDLADRATVRAGSAERMLSDPGAGPRGTGSTGTTFDVAFVDPPYETHPEPVAALLSRLAERVPGGTIVLERPARGGAVEPPAGWSVT